MKQKKRDAIKLEYNIGKKIETKRKGTYEMTVFEDSYGKRTLMLREIYPNSPLTITSLEDWDDLIELINGYKGLMSEEENEPDEE